MQIFNIRNSTGIIYINIVIVLLKLNLIIWKGQNFYTVATTIQHVTEFVII